MHKKPVKTKKAGRARLHLRPRMRNPLLLHTRAFIYFCPNKKHPPKQRMLKKIYLR